MPETPENPFDFWQELKRRRVLRIIPVYAAAAFVLLELEDIISGPFNLPDHTLKVLIFLLSIGFVLSLVLSWIYDLTPEGVKKTQPIGKIKKSASETPPQTRSWKISTYLSIAVIIGLLLLNIFSVNLNPFVNKEETISIAVLPFENWTSDEAFVHLGDAISNEISTQLAKIGEYHVISFTSSKKYKGEGKLTIPEIGKELAADILIEGSIEPQQESVSIQVQIIESDFDNHLWADEFKGKWDDIFTIRAAIPIKIAENLKTSFTKDEKEQIKRISTNNSAAHYHYMIGNLLISQFEFSEATIHFKQAIELDSMFAEAYAGMAYANYYQGGWTSTEFIPKAKEWVNRALEINDHCGEAYCMLGNIKYTYEYDWRGAEDYFKKGMSLNPDFLIGRAEYANFLTAMCRFEEAIEIHRQTVLLAPQDPTILGELAYTLTLSEQYEEALDLFKGALATDPASPHINSLVTLLYTMQGDYDSALVYWKNLVDDNDLSDLNTFFLGQGGHIYGRMGQSDMALSYLHELNRKVSEGETVPYSAFAFIYIGLGEYDKAISALEKAYDKRDPVLVWLKAHSYYFKPLRSEAGFEKLLKKMGFEL